jgi:hypothetical protein
MCFVRPISPGQSRARVSSECAQIIRHVAKFPDHSGIAEITRSRITREAKRDRADVTFLAQKRLSAHHDRDRIEAFHWLTSRNAVIGGDEWQSNVIG